MTVHKVEGPVTLEGEQFVAYHDERDRPRVLISKHAPDECRAFDAWLAQKRAPALAWQCIYRSGGATTARARVPGGWLVKHSSADGSSMVYVPDTRGSWAVKTEGEL